MAVPTSALLGLYGHLVETTDGDLRLKFRRAVVFDVDDIQTLIEQTPDERRPNSPWCPPYDPTLYVTRSRWFLLQPTEPLKSATCLAAGTWDRLTGVVTGCFSEADFLRAEGHSDLYWDLRELAGMAAALAACRNVTIQTIRPPRAYRRHGVRNVAWPLIEWKLLLLYPKSSDRRGATIVGSSQPRRYHTVRGHIKHTKWGMFWWHPHWRGRPELGVITKDYRVSA